MITKKQYMDLRDRALKLFDEAGIALTEQEKESVEVADFGLGKPYETGLESIVYVATERVCAKELALISGQTCPEHYHPEIGLYPGKEETFRCRYGTVYLYVEGEPADNIRAYLPLDAADEFSVFHEVILKEGEQYTILPKTKHWFQAAEGGAVVSEFSTYCDDSKDVFTDKRIKREAIVE